MKKFICGMVIALGLVAAGGASARSDVRDGNALVQPGKNQKYSIDGFTMGKDELFGYISDLKDREHLTGIVGAGTAAVLFQVNRYVAGAFVSIGGSYFVEGFVNQFSAVLVALTPFLRKCVVVTGGKILTPVC